MRLGIEPLLRFQAPEEARRDLSNGTSGTQRLAQQAPALGVEQYPDHHGSAGQKHQRVRLGGYTGNGRGCQTVQLGQGCVGRIDDEKE